MEVSGSVTDRQPSASSDEVLRRNLDALELRIERACERVGRNRNEVTLVAVTKTHPIEVLRGAYDLGLRDFGENRVQELLFKAEALPKDIRWHLIGHLQSNKAKYIAPVVTLVHSIDSIDTARELSKRAEQAGRTIAVLLEVNISGEHQKEGIEAGEVEGLIGAIVHDAPRLELRGLMGVASYETDVERVRPQFQALFELLQRSKARFDTLDAFDQLSMGMTNDFEVAIEEGATIIRVGSALFGERDRSMRI